MKEIFYQVDLMDKEMKHGQMELHIRDNINQEKNLEEEHLLGEVKREMMEEKKIMLESLKMMYFMDKEDMNGKMEEFTMEIGLKEKWKEKVYLYGQVII